MPTYEYECTDCGHRFEMFQRITDDPVSTCKKCSGHVRRVLFPVGILFKGPGFHVTDYRKPEPSSSTEDKSSESKPDKPKETVDSGSK